jgi:dinuclear metal center YbgI/SA1388 family protein
MALIRANISLYAAHTTFDRAQGGINDALAQSLGLIGVSTASGAGEGLMRVGELAQALDRAEMIAHVKKALALSAVRVSVTDCGLISRVAVVSGSGGDFVAAAKSAGAQALITGEVKHHHFIEAAQVGLLLVEAGHFHTECAFADLLYMSLQSSLNEVQLDLGLIKAENDKAPNAYE